MFLKYFVLIISSVMLSFAEQVSVSLPDAVNINHKLIKDLYVKNNKTEEKLLELEKIINKLTNEKTSYTQKDYLGKNDNYFVVYQKLNIRNVPNIKNSAIVGEFLFGNEVVCKTDVKHIHWCKISDNQYVYKKGLSSIDNKLILVTKNTELQSINPSIKVKANSSKGDVLSSKGDIENKWYVLENNLLLKKENAIEVSKGHSN